MFFTLVFITSLTAAPPFAPKVRPYDVLSYSLEVHLEDDGTFKNRLKAKVRALKPLKDIEFDAYNLTPELALVDGAAATPSPRSDPVAKTGVMIIKLPKGVAAGQELTIEIAYSGKAVTSEEGFYVKQSDDGTSPPSYFTNFEPMYAQRFFPCNDQPADKATFELTAVVDEKYMVLSNGRKERDDKFSENGRNLRRVTWVQDKPQSVYLTALAIGQFEAVVAAADIPATIWVRPGTKDRAVTAANSLKQLYTFMVEATGTRSPWAKLDVVAVPHQGFSGMENTSLIFERESKLVLETKNDQPGRLTIVNLMAHEIAHQWFGNDVTCAWWDDMWLNEGFATYLGALAYDDYNDNDEVEMRRVTSAYDEYFREENGPHSHALVPATPLSAEELFDSTSYVKGAALIRMLELWVGKPALKASMKAYLEKYAFSAATSADFFKVVAATTKNEKDLKAFKDAWLLKKGYPVLLPEMSMSGNRLTVKIRQQPNRPDEKGPFVFKLPIVVHRVSEPAFTKEQVIVVDKPEVTVSFDVMAAPEWVNWNKDFYALAQVNPASVSEEQWTMAARSDPDPTWRIIATRNLLGEMGNPRMKAETKPTESAMGAIIDVLEKDPSSYVRLAVLESLVKTRFKRLPHELSATIFALSKKPTGLADDAIGIILVRSTAMTVLGKTDSSEGHQYLIDELSQKEIDINYLSGIALGVAELGNSAAVATLRTALLTQKGRGYPYYRRVAETLGGVANGEVVGLLREVLKDSDNELSQGICYKIDDNPALKDTNEFAGMVRDFVLDEKGLALDSRMQFLGLLDEVKNDWAKEVLLRIVDTSKSAPIKAAAKKTLDVNFPLKK